MAMEAVGEGNAILNWKMGQMRSVGDLFCFN